MPINTEHYRKLLLDKERDLVLELSELKNDEQPREGREVGDSGDEATREIETNVAVEEASVLTKTLAEVRDALQRIEQGTYGKCTVCGRAINPARLEAIPWTQYCVEHG